MLDVFVLCRSEKYVARWQEHSKVHPGVRFHFKSNYTSYYRFILDAMTESSGPHFMVAHDDIWFGKGFFGHIPALLSELSELAPNWGVVGNAGICINGDRRFRYIRDPHDGPLKSESAKPVVGVDGNLMLINKEAFIKHGVEFPDLGGFHGYDMILCFELLRKGLLPLADHRLAIYHESAGSNEGFQEFIRSRPFLDYISTRFINHKIPNINDTLHLDKIIRYSYLTPDQQGERADLVELFDKALLASRAQRKPSLTIVCRTQCNRPALLTRAILSFAAASHHTKGLVELETLIVTDQTQDRLDAELARLRQTAGDLKLSGRSLKVQSERHSRADLLVQAVEQCDSDYIWFVDDDDYVMPNALTDIARYLASNGTTFMTADCMRYDEEWEDITNPTSFVPIKTKQINRTSGSHIYLSFSGDNFVPVCGCIFPVKALRQQLQGMSVSGDYSEDYFLLMLTLCAPHVELIVLPTIISGISIRGQENTVTVSDRSHWNYSYACFMTELLNSEKTGSAVFWQFARPTPNMLRGVIAEARIGTMPRSVRFLMNLGYTYVALRLAMQNPDLIKENLAKCRWALKNGGVSLLIRKISQFAQQKINR